MTDCIRSSNRFLLSGMLLVGVACSCGVSGYVQTDLIIYEEGKKPSRGDMGIGPRYYLVTRTDIERLDHLDENTLVYRMKELCECYDRKVQETVASWPASERAKGAIPVVSLPFLWQNVEELRWALILRGEPALDQVIRAIRDIDFPGITHYNSSYFNDLAETLNKWQSERATNALVDLGAELAARPDVGRKTIHIVLAATMYGRFGEENAKEFLGGKRIAKLRSIVVRLMGFKGVSKCHARFFNRFFPEQAIDLGADDGLVPKSESL